MRRNNLSRITIFIGLLLVLALVATGCSSDDADSDDTAVATVAETTTTTVATTVADTTQTIADQDHEGHENDDEGHGDDHEGHDHGDEGEHEGEASAESDGGVVEVDEPRRLLVVASTDQAVLELIDLADGSAVSIELQSPVAGHGTSITESGRFLLVAHAGDEGGVTVVDTGVWSEPHGNHFHHYTSPPVILGRVEGPRPSHLSSHDGLNALWFDGSGEFVVITEESLSDGELTVMAEVATGQAHHGFAVPTHGEYFVTVPTDDMEGLPNVVGISDIDGVVEAESDCPATHGETILANGGASACGDGIVLVTEDAGSWTSTYISYPQVDDEDPFGFGPARAWILRAASDQSLLTAPYGTRHLLVANPGDETIRTFDLEQTVAIVGLRWTDDGRVVVLTGDGFIHLFDPDVGVVVTSLAVVTPFQEGPGVPWREVAVTGDRVYVTDPAHKLVVEVAIGDGLAVERTFPLDFTPAGFLGVANG